MSAKKRIILLEDEDHIRKGIRLNLEAEGFEVIAFSDGKSALARIDEFQDVVLGIFDVMLPGGMDGFDFCRKIREKYYNFPVIFLSARTRLEDKLAGFQSGGDDYLTKPFDLEELLARVHARIKFLSGTDDKKNSVSIGSFEVDLESGTALHPGEEPIRFNLRELNILRLFVENRGKPISRDLILDTVWGENEFPTNRTIDNYILKFRKIFEPDQQNPRYFITRHGMGYELANEE